MGKILPRGVACAPLPPGGRGCISEASPSSQQPGGLSVRVSSRSILVSAGLAVIAGLVPAAALGGANVGILVLKEHGVGTSAQGQPYLDQLTAVAKDQNGW